LTLNSESGKMQEGIRLYKEGKADEAYRVFQQLARRDPENEFAWIWISVTSSNVEEKRAALQNALQINPNSSHAKDALRDLDLRTVTPQARTMAEGDPTIRLNRPPIPAPPPDFLPPESDLDPLAALRDTPNGKKTRKQKAPPVIVVTEPGASKAQQRVAGTARRIRVIAFAVLAILAVVLIFTIVQNNNKPKDGEQASVTTTEAVTTTADATITPAVTSAEVTTMATGTSAAVTTAAVSAATTIIPSNTAAPSTTTTAAPTTTAAAVTTVVPGQAGASGPVSEQVQNLLKAGRQSVAAGDYKTALTAINDALKLDNRNVVANLELGMVYLKAPNDQAVGNVNRADEALKAFKKVTDQAPTWAAGWARLGDAQATKGDIPGAIKSYVRSLELDANGAERWLVLAGLYDQNKQTAEATYARQRAQAVK